jgi:hypothetical protein
MDGAHTVVLHLSAVAVSVGLVTHSQLNTNCEVKSFKQGTMLSNVIKSRAILLHLVSYAVSWHSHVAYATSL